MTKPDALLVEIDPAATYRCAAPKCPARGR